MNRNYRFGFLALVFLLLFQVALSWPIVLKHSSKKLVVEVARTAAEQEIGLMRRKNLRWDHGMLFVFSDDTVRYFWMKNTSIPLDIAFMDRNGKVLSIKSMAPYSLDMVSSEEPCRFALEVNRGYFKKLPLHEGETFESVVKQVKLHS